MKTEISGGTPDVHGAPTDEGQLAAQGEAAIRPEGRSAFEPIGRALGPCVRSLTAQLTDSTIDRAERDLAGASNPAVLVDGEFAGQAS
jgi:hypothetical protein